MTKFNKFQPGKHAETMRPIVTKDNTRGIRSSWQDVFSKFFSNPRFGFDGTGWESVYAKLSAAPTKTARGAEPFWVGVELTHPSCDLGYVGVLCADHAGEVLCTSVLQERISALDYLRSQWPGDQLRFLTDMDGLRSAARRSIVFGAVVDAGSRAALSLAESLANEITDGNTRTALRVLAVVAPPSSRRAASAVDPFDVLLKSKTTEPWLEHRDLAMMCAVQKAGLIGVDFRDVCGIFKKHKKASDSWLSKRPRPVGAKASGIARGPSRATSATKRALRGISESLTLSQATGAIIDISGGAQSLRLIEYRTVMKLIREACANADKFVLGDNHSNGFLEFLNVQIIAATGGRRERIDHQLLLERPPDYQDNAPTAPKGLK